MKVIDRTNRRSVPSGVRGRGARCLAMSSALILFGLYSSCGGGGGGGGGSCANTLNIEGDWIFTYTITSVSGECEDPVPGETFNEFGFITQAGRLITFLIDGQFDAYTGEVCGNDMDLYLQDCVIDGECITEDWIGTISADTNTIAGYGFADLYDENRGVPICSAEYDVFGSRASLIGGGDGQNGASVFNYDDEVSALVFARSTYSSPTRTQILGTVLPREGGDFPLPPGYWDLYMTYPGEHTRQFELAR